MTPTHDGPPAAGGLADAVWLITLALAGALAIVSAPWALDRPLLNIIFKPLATLALIALAWRRGGAGTMSEASGLSAGTAPGARALRAGTAPEARALRAGAAPEARALRAGLVLSLIGDVALLWPREGFIWGLLAFLLAHLSYLYAFTRRARLAQWWPAFAAYFAVAALVLSHLWSGIEPGLRVPVLAYVACLAAMAAQAAVLWRLDVPRARWFALGGALFVVSDALLASNKFVAVLPWASLWILGTYWSAQLALVWGLPPRRRDTHA